MCTCLVRVSGPRRASDVRRVRCRWRTVASRASRARGGARTTAARGRTRTRQHRSRVASVTSDTLSLHIGPLALHIPTNSIRLLRARATQRCVCAQLSLSCTAPSTVASSVTYNYKRIVRVLANNSLMTYSWRGAHTLRYRLRRVRADADDIFYSSPAAPRPGENRRVLPCMIHPRCCHRPPSSLSRAADVPSHACS